MATGRHPRVPPLNGSRDLLDRPEHPARSNVLEQVGEEVDLSEHGDLVSARPVSGPLPTPAPAPDPGVERSTSSVQIAGLGGLGVLFVTLDQALKSSGKTLADLTINSGPLSGALVANWPIVFSVAWLAWSLRRWYLDQRRREGERNARQDAAQATQAHQLRRIARSVDGLRAAFLQTADDHDRRLARCEGELDALLGERVPNGRRRGTPPRTPLPE
jgi:hypothetical protein